LGFNLRVGSDVGLTEMRFKVVVINPGSDGVVISRTRVGYWYVRWKIRVKAMTAMVLVEAGSDFCLNTDN
jgi:hypothetical protein